IAVRTGQREHADLLRKHGAQGEEVREIDRAIGACFAGEAPPKAERRFVRADQQMLSWALCHDASEAVPALLALGLDPNVPDYDGETPLHLAKSGPARDALLRANARKDATNFRGETPFGEKLHDVPNALFEEAADAVVNGDLARLEALLDR